MDTPVLFLVFNRPDVTKTIFEAIRKAQPKQLFVAADGPRPHVAGEKERCEEVRNIVKQIDWDCRLQTRFLDQNLGCGKAVSSAITWFFENVEAGIILEDDCLPDPSFFTYCESVLKKYADNPRIMLVTGDNFQNGIQRGDASYYFSRLAHIWGWATWRRAWQKYDFNLTTFPQFKAQARIRDFHSDPNVQQHFLAILEKMYHHEIDTWDFQVYYMLMQHNGLSITPNKNLVTNLGFGEGATHTLDANSSLANMTRFSLDNIVHPQAIIPNQEADDYTLSNVLGIPMQSKVSTAV